MTKEYEKRAQYSGEQFELMRGLHSETDANASEAARRFFASTGIRVSKQTILNHWKNRWDLQTGAWGGRRESILEESVAGATPRSEEDEIVKISIRYHHVLAKVVGDPRVNRPYATVERILERRGITPVKTTYKSRKKII